MSKESGLRTFEDVAAIVEGALSSKDVALLLACAEELESFAEPTAEALAHIARGSACRLQGRYQEALRHFHDALIVYNVTDNRAGIARVTGSIGNVYFSLGNYSTALEFYNQALPLHVELGNRKGVAIVTGNIASVHFSTGDFPASLECCHSALLLHEELDDSWGIARVTGTIGNIFFNTGNYSDALEHCQRALTLSEALSDKGGVARFTGNIGNVYNKLGDYAAAIEYYNRALLLHKDFGDRSGVARVTTNIGIVHSAMGEYTAALRNHNIALGMYQELGERDGLVTSMVNIASVHVAMGSDDEAMQILDSLDSMQVDSPGVRMECELNRAALHIRNQAYDNAANTLQTALETARDLGLRAREAELHKMLRNVAQGRNNLVDYIKHNDEYTRLIEEVAGKDTALRIAMLAKQREIDAERKEHEKHIAVLHSMLPKDIADRVARGETVNDQYDGATVIFMDIVDFTSISDRIQSDRVVYLLEQIFTALDIECGKHNVVKIKTIGDSYMAVSFHSATNAAMCALAMRDSLRALDLELPSLTAGTHSSVSQGEVSVRIGLHCGPLTAGVLGTQRMQFDVWGDTVNVASRMESTCQPGRIHVSEAFARAARVDADAPYRFESRGTIEVKGKGKMETYWLLRE